jgi:hypothetical protein
MALVSKFTLLAWSVLMMALLPGCVTVLPSKSSKELSTTNNPVPSGYFTYESQSFLTNTETLRTAKDFTVSRITYPTPAGETVIDYYQHTIPSQEIILVFPILGGTKNPIENYFAEYFTEQNYDAAIVHRGKDFKDPKHFRNLEQLLKDTVIRDRLAMDYFSKVHGKKKFASFGISRGAINAAMTAGVDKRLEYNVLALGGSDISEIMTTSSESRMERYCDEVKIQEGIDDEELLHTLGELRTDPKHVASQIDPAKTMLFLALFDSSVPIASGEKLRAQIGYPKTTYLLAGHRTSLLFTQIVPLFPPCRCFGIFPFDYIESEALRFYDKGFKRKRLHPKHYLFELFQLPGYLLQSVF